MVAMSASVQSGAGSTPRKSFDGLRPHMAKADLKELETAARADYGRLLEWAIAISGMNKSEACIALGECFEGGKPLDPAQLSRWLSGTENPQMWRWQRVQRLRDSLRVAEAMKHGLRVRTVIEDDRVAS
jgi:hypothetical protein